MTDKERIEELEAAIYDMFGMYNLDFVDVHDLISLNDISLDRSREIVEIINRAIVHYEERHGVTRYGDKP